MLLELRRLTVPPGHRVLLEEVSWDELDLTLDPPPDLALEIDITSRTHPRIYEALGVPELWRFKKGQLQINILQSDGKYAVQERSSIFPNLPIVENLPNDVR